MPAETIYSSSADGAIENGGPGYGGSSWATVSTLTTGQYLSSASTTENVFALLVAGRGAAFYAIRRYFLYFDMSSFPSYSSIDSLTLSIYRDDGGGDSVIAVRHDAPSVHLNNTEFVFFPSHDPAGGDSMTAYSSANTESTGSYNDFVLNATAITELTACIEGSGNGGVGTSSFEVALVANLDFTNTAATDRSVSTRWRSQEYSGTGSDPHIKVIYSTAAVTHNATFFGANF